MSQIPIHLIQNKCAHENSIPFFPCFRVDEVLVEIVRSLSNSQRAERANAEQLLKASDLHVHRKFPWLVQNNTLSNYFLSSSPGETYHSGSLVFLHHHRTAGTAIRDCLETIGEQQRFGLSPNMVSNQRRLWDAHEVYAGEVRNKLKIHRGQYSFGICDGIQRNCSYFTLLRDPMERAISSYYYCQHSLGDEMCRVLNANHLTLRDWVIHQGSLLFQQILFQANICDLEPKLDRFHEHHSEDLIDSKTMPCWFKHKLYIEQLPMEEQHSLIRYIANNLHRWFAVIGLYDEMDSSLQMLEHIYRLPFRQCENFKQIESNTEDNRSNRKKRKSGSYDDFDPEFLKYDYEVQRALMPDYKIYHAAKRIFRRQIQVFSNKLWQLFWTKLVTILNIMITLYEQLDESYMSFASSFNITFPLARHSYPHDGNPLTWKDGIPIIKWCPEFVATDQLKFGIDVASVCHIITMCLNVIHDYIWHITMCMNIMNDYASRMWSKIWNDNGYNIK